MEMITPKEMTARPLSPTFWEVVDSEGRVFGVTRIISAEENCRACECGGCSDERDRKAGGMDNICEHIRTIECAVECHWGGAGLLKQIIDGGATA
jgi:hypothetical protein